MENKIVYREPVNLRLVSQFAFAIEFKFDVAMVDICRELNDEYGLSYIGGRWICDVRYLDEVMRSFNEYDVQVNSDVTRAYAEWLHAWEQFEGEVEVIKRFKEAPVGDLFLPNLNFELFPYQKKGVEFLHEYKRVLLADSMGLGKSVQTLCSSKMLGGRVLILTPKTLIWNWQREVKKFFKGVDVYVVTGTRRDRQKIYDELFEKDDKEFFVITNYESVRSDEYVYFTRFCNFFFETVIWDEASKCKNRESQLYKTVSKIKTRNAFLLSGTPLMNNPGELWSLLHYLAPVTFKDYWKFVRRYAYVSKGQWGGFKVEGCKNPEELHKIVSRFMLRRTKDEIKDQLPERLDDVVYVDMEPKQKELYRKVNSEFLDWYKEQYGKANKGAILTKLVRLKQAANDAGLLEAGLKGVSGKYIELESIVEELYLNDRSALVFTQFRGTSEYLKSFYEKKYGKKSVAYIDGDVPVEERYVQVDKFMKNPDCFLFIGTTKSMGMGLNLTKADTVIHVDKLWNPAETDQATDRAYRLGQENNSLTVISLVAKGTIDELIEGLLQKKRHISDQVIDGVFDEEVKESKGIDDLVSLIKKGAKRYEW